jgi:hypothetical protein
MALGGRSHLQQPNVTDKETGSERLSKLHKDVQPEVSDSGSRILELTRRWVGRGRLIWRLIEGRKES